MPDGVDDDTSDDGDVFGDVHVDGVYAGGSGGSAVTQATCADGVVTVPTVVPVAAPAGVTYVLDPAGSV